MNEAETRMCVLALRFIYLSDELTTADAEEAGDIEDELDQCREAYDALKMLIDVPILSKVLEHNADHIRDSLL